MTRSILITGGAGFIGSRLALTLVVRGHRVRVLDSLSRQIHGEKPDKSVLYRAVADRVEFLRGDVTCDTDLAPALAGIDTVVHLAAETGTGQSMSAINHYTKVNTGGMALLLDNVVNRYREVDRIVVASSRAVVGEGRYRCPEHGDFFPGSRRVADMESGDFDLRCPTCGTVAAMQPTGEDAPPYPSSIYGITKLSQEQMTLTVGRALGISAIAFRYQNVYGPGQSLSNPYTGILSIFSTRICQGKPINIFEDGKESRDFVFIDDVIDATVRGIEYQGPLVDVFNVGSGVATDVLTVARMLRDALSGDSEITISGQYRAGDIRHNLADLSKVSRQLGFQPQVSFEHGLRRFVEWVRGEALAVDRYEESLQELVAKGLFK